MSADWIIPLSESGSPCDFDGEIYPGVKGYAIFEDGEIWIPDVRCDVQNQFLRFLHLLESYEPPIVIANVVNARLARVLKKRGWRMTAENILGETVDTWRFIGNKT